VDDNPVNRRLLESILGRQGYQTTVAADGEQAIAMGLSRDFDLILLDVMMPGKDGYQVCAELKRAQRCAETPIIFVSALAEADDHVKGLELGAADYINKPFNRGEVLARVNTHIQIGTLTRELRRMNSELLARQLLLEQDLAAAREIQASLLPRSRSIAEPWVKIDWCFEPCDSVSGDVFNVFWLDHEHLGAYIVDVCGHGVPAAMVTVAVSRSLSPDNGWAVERTPDGQSKIASPGEVLRRLDAEYPMERFGKFLTIVYLVLNCRTQRLAFSCAGHPPPLLVRGDGQIESLNRGGTIIGLGGGVPFDEGEIELHPSDRVFLYTDGVFERENAAEEAFGQDRVAHELYAARGDSLPVACERLTRQLNVFARGAPPTDDITLCGLELQNIMKG
jgi:sigma-B regulation protein RsbU (phosphoserine phosphatase)